MVGIQGVQEGRNGEVRKAGLDGTECAGGKGREEGRVHAYRREWQKETREQKPDFEILSTSLPKYLPNLLSPLSLQYGHSLPTWFSPSILFFNHPQHC